MVDEVEELVRVRVGVRARMRVRVRVRVRFVFFSLGFSVSEYIHAAFFSMWCVCVREKRRES